MPEIKEQIGNPIRFQKPFERIISLVPSQTELLVHLVGKERVIGRTKFCIHPQEAIEKIPIIGGTKKFNFKQIRELKPDLIIANKEENYKDGIEMLSQDFPVWTSDIFDLADNYSMIESLGKLTGSQKKANQIVADTKEVWEAIKDTKQGKALYFIWQKPYMVAGRNTFINHIMAHLGIENLCIQQRYPEMDPYILERMDPDYVMLSSEPFPFQAKHMDAFKKMFPKARILLVDGEMFSWYGIRLIMAAEYFKNLSL